MSFYRENIYPRLVSALGDPPPIREVRRRLIPLASGKVLEVGAGPGVNFALYDPFKSEQGLRAGTQPRNDSARRATTAANQARYRISGPSGRKNSIGRQRR